MVLLCLPSLVHSLPPDTHSDLEDSERSSVPRGERLDVLQPGLPPVPHPLPGDLGRSGGGRGGAPLVPSHAAHLHAPVPHRGEVGNIRVLHDQVSLYLLNERVAVRESAAVHHTRITGTQAQYRTFYGLSLSQ